MTKFKNMVNGKRKGKSGRRLQHGGARPGAGRPEGRTKVKICVSIDALIFSKAKQAASAPFSQLVEMLLDQYAPDPVN